MNKQTEKARSELKWPVDKRINMRHTEQVVNEFIESCRSDAKKEAETLVDVMRAENKQLRSALAKARSALCAARNNHGIVLMSDPPHEAWKFNCVDDQISNAIAAIDALKGAKL